MPLPSFRVLTQEQRDALGSSRLLERGNSFLKTYENRNAFEYYDALLELEDTAWTDREKQQALQQMYSAAESNEQRNVSRHHYERGDKWCISVLKMIDDVKAKDPPKMG